MASGTITTAVSGVKESLGTVTSFLDEGGQWDKMAKQGIQYTSTAKKNASYASGVPFGLVGLGGALSLLGVFMMTTCPGRKEGDHPMKLGIKGKCGSCFVGCGWFLTCVSMLILSLLCTILWPVMFLSVDVCGVLEKIPSNISNYAPLPPGPGQMLQYCFRASKQNVSFIPDEMVDGFDFSQTVSFNSAGLKSQIDELFTNLPMDKLREVVDNMTNWDAISQTQGTWQQQQRKKDIMKIKGMMANVTKFEQDFKDQMKISIDNIGQIQNITLPMFNFATELKQDFSCKAVGVEYEGTVDILCGDILSGMSLFVAAMLGTVLMGAPLAFGGICINRAYGGHGLPPAGENEDDEGKIMELQGVWSPSNAYDIRAWDDTHGKGKA